MEKEERTIHVDFVGLDKQEQIVALVTELCKCLDVKPKKRKAKEIREANRKTERERKKNKKYRRKRA